MYPKFDIIEKERKILEFAGSSEALHLAPTSLGEARRERSPEQEEEPAASGWLSKKACSKGGVAQAVSHLSSLKGSGSACIANPA
jgi:hypothetical protein